MHSSRLNTLTLLITLSLCVLLFASQPAAATPNAAHHRILRKRADPATDPKDGDFVPLIGVGNGPGAPGDTTSSTTTSTTSSSTTTGPSISNPLDGSISTTTTSSSSTTTTSSTESSTTSTSALPTTSSSSSSTVETTTQAPLTSVVRGTTVVTATSSQAPLQTASEETQALAQKSSIAVTVLIGVGASIGGIVIIWILYRGWQRSRADKVDARMQPIDFRPTGFEDEALPGEHRRHSGASFNSYTHGSGSNDGHSSHGHYNNSNMDHDFTAGNTNLAPVGGYADLARGASPQPPQMQEMPTSHTGYSSQLPLHHQGGAYDQGVTPLTFKY